MDTNEQNALVAKSVVASVLITLLLIGGSAYAFRAQLKTLLQREVSSGGTTQNGVVVPASSGNSSIPDVVSKTSPAVVSVIITANVPVLEQYYQQFRTPFDNFFGPGFNMQIPSQRQVGTKQEQIGGGTGFFVSKDGYILTNKHVVDVQGATYSIKTQDGTTYDVDVVAKDPSLDIAVLKVKNATTTFPYLTFGDSKSLRLGDSVIAIGNALAEFPNSVSVGVVSGLSRNIVAGDLVGGGSESLQNVIQTDAAINQGNSGGPLLDGAGNVIGMNVAVAGNSQNIGFAIPSDVVERVYQNVAKNGKIVVPFLGVRYLQITPDIAKSNDLSVDYGVLIERGQTNSDLAVIPGSPADKAGLVENDIILEVDGKKLDGTDSLSNMIRGYKVGDTITLKVMHRGETKDVTLTLAQEPNTK